MKLPLLQLHILTTVKLNEAKEQAASRAASQATSRAKASERKKSDRLITGLLCSNYELRKTIASSLSNRN